MGFQDRDYAPQSPRGFQLGGPRMLVTNLVIINVVIYLVDILFMKGQLGEFMALRVTTIREPWMWWQFVSYGFAHDPNNWLHVAGNMFCLWFFGREIEQVYGKRTFLLFYLSTIILAGLVWVGEAALDLSMFEMTSVMGASGGVSGIILLYIMHFPQRTLLLFGVIPIKAWVLGVVYVAMDFYGTFKDENSTTAHSAHLAGFGLGVLFYYRKWHLFTWLPESFSLASLRSWQTRRHLRIHDPDTGKEAKLADEVDRILEKISREGEASLTSRERKTLESASRKLRKRKGE